MLLLNLMACSSGEKDVVLFEKLDSKKTHIDFSNNITETKDFNILDYLYFYNGGGISAGDINNDGLVDLFFVSNQGKNKLYLNKYLIQDKVMLLFHYLLLLPIYL